MSSIENGNEAYFMLTVIHDDIAFNSLGISVFNYELHNMMIICPYLVRSYYGNPEVRRVTNKVEILKTAFGYVTCN